MDKKRFLLAFSRFQLLSKTNILSNTLNSRIRICLDLRRLKCRQCVQWILGSAPRGEGSAWGQVSQRDCGDVKFPQIQPQRSPGSPAGCPIWTSVLCAGGQTHPSMQQETRARARARTKWGSRLCGQSGSHTDMSSSAKVLPDLAQGTCHRDPAHGLSGRACRV